MAASRLKVKRESPVQSCTSQGEPLCHLCGEAYHTLFECKRWRFDKYEGRVGPDNILDQLDNDSSYETNSVQVDSDGEEIKREGPRKVAVGRRKDKLTKAMSRYLGHLVGLPFTCKAIQDVLVGEYGWLWLATHHRQLAQRWSQFSCASTQLEVGIANKQAMRRDAKTSFQMDRKAHAFAIRQAVNVAHKLDKDELTNKLLASLSPTAVLIYNKLAKEELVLDIMRPRWWETRIQELEAKLARRDRIIFDLQEQVDAKK